VIVKPLPKFTPTLSKTDRSMAARIKKITHGKKLRNAKKAAIRRLFKGT